MTLFDNPDFFLGALAACSALVLTLGCFVFRARPSPKVRSRSPTPVLLFLVPYLGFLALSFARPFIAIEDVPSVQTAVYYAWAADPLTVALYLLGGLSFYAGYILSPAFGRRYGGFIESLFRPGFEKAKSFLRGRKVHFFLLSVLLLWVIGLGANIALFIQVRGIPLFQIGIRESEDPKLTFLAQFQPLLVLAAPYVTTLRGTIPGTLSKSLLRVFKPQGYAVLILISLTMLTLLGARNLPAKLALSLFVFWLLSPVNRVSEPNGNRGRGRFSLANKKLRIAVALGIVLFTTIGLAGALSKVEIYRLSPQSLPGTIMGAPVADSIGNLYSFQALANYSGMYGRFHGGLLYTTYLSYIPGRDELYANYVVGEILGYPASQLQSISSTFNGPALLDFGILGLILNSLLFGGLLGYGWHAARGASRNLGAFSLFLASLILDIHLGTYNIWTAFPALILIATVEYNKVP